MEELLWYLQALLVLVAEGGGESLLRMMDSEAFVCIHRPALLHSCLGRSTAVAATNAGLFHRPH
jgi:hypothetical protein